MCALSIQILHPIVTKLQHNSIRTIKTRKRTSIMNVSCKWKKRSFTPLIFTTYGGMGPECAKYHKKVAQLISKKRNESYADVMNVIRTKIRFSILKSTLEVVRGVRRRRQRETPTSDISYNTVPSACGIRSLNPSGLRILLSILQWQFYLDCFL